jgi:hypothetical protein
VLKIDPFPLNATWPITTCLALPCRHVIYPCVPILGWTANS